MRSNATIASEQVKASVTPYVSCHYCTSAQTFAANAHDCTADLIEVEFTEQPYRTYAVITLDNSDSHYDSVDFRKYWFRIGRGFTVGGSDYVSYPQYVQVFHQQAVSMPGQVWLRLYCHGNWERLARWTVDDVKGYIFNDTDSVHTTVPGSLDISDIINWACETKAGVEMGENLEDLSGNWVETKTPALCVEQGENAKNIVQWLLQRTTNCVLKPTTGHDPEGDLCLMEGNSGSSVTYHTVYTAEYGTAKLAVAEKKIPWPLKVTVKTDEQSISDPTTYTNTYTATLADDGVAWESGLGEYTYLDDINVCVSNDNCLTLAGYMVKRAVAEAEQGIFDLAIADCLLELYDQVTVIDDRGDAAISNGVVGMIYFHYKPSRNAGVSPIFRMRVRCGGLNLSDFPTTGVSEPTDPIPSPTDVQPYRQMHWGDIPPEWLSEGIQPWIGDIVWTSADPADRGLVTWTCEAPTIRFYSGDSLSLASSHYHITDDYTHYFYFDLDTDPTTVKRSTTFADVVGPRKGLLAVAVRGAATDTRALILPNNSKFPVINASLLYADMILAAHIKAGEIIAGHLEAGVTARMFTDAAEKTATNAGAALAKSWESATAGLIEGADLLAGSIVTNKLAALPADMMDGKYSSFEVWDAGTSGYAPTGWSIHAGAASRWARDNAEGTSGYCARGAGNSADQYLQWGQRIYANAGDIITFTCRICQIDANGDCWVGWKPCSATDADLGNQGALHNYTEYTDNTWYTITYTAVLPANTRYIVPLVGVESNNTGNYWYFDNVSVIRSSNIIVLGTINASGVQINGDSGITIWSDDSMHFKTSSNVASGDI